MRTKAKAGSDRTTLGDLVVAITDRARKVAANEQHAYRLAGFVLSRMLRPLPEVETLGAIRFAIKKTASHQAIYRSWH